MFKYLISILVVLLCIFFYLNYPKEPEDPGSIKIGEVFYIRVVDREDLSAFFKRISSTQVLFSFLEEGEQPQVDSNSESAYNVGGEISVLGGTCKIKFDSMQDSYKGNLECTNLNKLKFRAFLQTTKEGGEVLEIAEDLRDKTGKVLAKIESLSDSILSKTLEMSDSERMISMFKEGVPLKYGENVGSSPSTINAKLISGRSSFLRASNEGQEIYLASRLLDEEAKVLLRQQKYSAKRVEFNSVNSDSVNSDVAVVPSGPEGNVVPEKTNNNVKPEGQWWKDLD